MELSLTRWKIQMDWTCSKKYITKINFQWNLIGKKFVGRPHNFLFKYIRYKNKQILIDFNSNFQKDSVYDHQRHDKETTTSPPKFTILIPLMPLFNTVNTKPRSSYGSPNFF